MIFLNTENEFEHFEEEEEDAGIDDELLGELEDDEELIEEELLDPLLKVDFPAEDDGTEKETIAKFDEEEDEDVDDYDSFDDRDEL